MNLDRVSLDGLAVHRRSATLHVGGGQHPHTRTSRWWVYLACGPILPEYDVSRRPVHLEASTVSGRLVEGRARIIDRIDDAYGTRLILAGSGSIAGERHLSVQSGEVAGEEGFEPSIS